MLENVELATCMTGCTFIGKTDMHVAKGNNGRALIGTYSSFRTFNREMMLISRGICIRYDGKKEESK